MQIMRGTETDFEVVDCKRNALLKSDSFEECQKFLAKNTKGLIYSPKYGMCLTQPELNRRGGKHASSKKTQEVA